MTEQTPAHPSPTSRWRPQRAALAWRESPRWRIALLMGALAVGAVALVAAIGGVSERPRAHTKATADARAAGTDAARTSSAARARSGTAPAGAPAATAGAPAAGSSAARAHATGAGAGTVGGARATAGEVADPQESSSYPAPASARHIAAATPAKAGEAVVAAGAPSDAEVKAELAQMERAEAAAARTQRQRLTPVPGGHSIGGNGAIPIPAGVPEVVQRVIAGANAIADFPYVYGGGHGSFVDNAYDCSGSVSYALAAGGLLSAPQTSGELESWGAPGPGRYITVLANAGHTYMYVDGILYDTAGRSGVFASRWQVQPVDNSGYVVRHWPGL